MMRKHKLVRFLVYGAVVVVALGALGYVANSGVGGSSHDTNTASTGDEFAIDDTSGDSGPAGANVDSTRQTIAPSPPEKDLPAPEAIKSGATSSAGSAGSTAQAPAAGPGSDALASTADRKIVQTATMSLQVKDVGGGFEEVGRIATGAGGFVASSSFSYKGDTQIASVTIRVPASAYQSVLGDLRALGEKVDSESSEANDVTEEYTDLSSRQRNLEATETQLLTLLAKANSISDILTVQDRLNDVRGQIEQIKGRIQMLDNLSDLATITLHLRPVVAPVENHTDHGHNVDLGHAVSEGWNNSIDFLGGIAEGVVKVVVFAWWIPLVGIPAWLVVWALTRHGPRTLGSVD
jgi:hypothetical protein